jgi:hypothetical protein
MRRVVLLLTGLLVLGPMLVAAPVAGASVAAHSPKFVGTYAVHGHLTEGGRVHGTLTVNADGTAHDQHNNPGHWTSSGKTFTLTATSEGITEILVGTLTKRGISTKKAPGTVTINGMDAGVWYALRTS